MGIESLTYTEEGRLIIPTTNADWQEWVGATATCNYVMDDPLLDWLDLYGDEHGFLRDDRREGYDARTDFSQFITRKGLEFEAAVAAYLKTLVPLYTVVAHPEQTRSLEVAEETFQAMQRGERVIYQAALRDAVTRTYGVADFLIRSDELHRLFPTMITVQEASIPAPDLNGAPWHYRVIDIKYTTLHFLTNNGLQETQGSTWAYMVQLFIYNRALGRLQGYCPAEAYLLGRGWEQTVRGQKLRGTSCMERLGIVPHEYISNTKGNLSDAADAACAWIRRVRAEGKSWQLFPDPSVPELRPNMGSTSDQPWHHAKQDIGYRLQDLTLLWHVGVEKRKAANEKGIFRWSDRGYTSEDLGVRGPKVAPILQAIIDVNRADDGGPVVRPKHISSAETEWREASRLEFYVDFETVNDLDDDFAHIPEKGGQPLIFMIGCGHFVEGQWQWSCFTADALTEACEAQIIDAWFAHMDAVKQKVDPDGDQPRVFHWSHAEQSTFETAFNSARERHPDKDWRTPRWFDFLRRVVKAEPVIIRGAFGFGLKAVAKAMYLHGYIHLNWDSGPTDGLGAMVGAWWCAAEAKARGCTLSDITLMQDIARYNEIDCKAIAEIVSYLRANH